YVLRATFQAMTSDKKVQEGLYVDTWKSATEWRREVTIGNSSFVRSQNGDTRFLKGEGPDEKLLRLVMHIMEPIPAIDTFVESDWRMKSETIDNIKTVRVLSGFESPEGVLDPEKARGYWFDTNGKLLRAFFNGLDVRRSSFEEFDAAQVARQIRVFYQDSLAV